MGSQKNTYLLILLTSSIIGIGLEYLLGRSLISATILGIAIAAGATGGYYLFDKLEEG